MKYCSKCGKECQDNVGRFYSGHTGIAIAQILVTIFTFGIGSIWGLIDGIVILCNDKFTDSKGKMMKD